MMIYHSFSQISFCFDNNKHNNRKRKRRKKQKKKQEDRRSWGGEGGKEEEGVGFKQTTKQVLPKTRARTIHFLGNHKLFFVEEP